MTDAIDPRLLSTTQIIFNAMDLDIELLNSPDIEYHRQKINEWLAKWELTIDPQDEMMGGNIYRFLTIASDQTGNDRITTIAKCYRKAQSYYYGMWAKGKIKAKKIPMPEDIKSMLRLKSQPKPIKDAELEKISVRDVEFMLDDELAKTFTQIYGPQVVAHTANFKRRCIINSIVGAISAGIRPSKGEADVITVVPTIKTNKITGKLKNKVPLYQDKVAQLEKEKRWPWVKPGSWCKDPDKETGTLATIICQICGTERICHAGDCFQCRLCSQPSCKKASKASK